MFFRKESCTIKSHSKKNHYTEKTFALTCESCLGSASGYYAVFEIVNLNELVDKGVANSDQKLCILKNLFLLQIKEDELLNIASG